MTTRYQTKHYEDVARLLQYHLAATDGPTDALLGAHSVVQLLIADFADLFAADNPPHCTHCSRPGTTGDLTILLTKAGEKHNREGGFDREQFLEACGLEGSD
ncbi:hypothetical protein LCGC14_0382200 [marine sediment metagenome]|uniref:Uncharacterized protein n=1 Tax=marine sediment metagenome TaxID=412755 RepID=A0A0F9VP06_9ZZZZ